MFGAGIGAYAANAARALAAGGHEVVVVTERGEASDERVEAVRGMFPGVEIVFAEFEGEGHHYERRARGVARVVRELHAEAPLDLVEVPDYYAEGLELVRGRAESRGGSRGGRRRGLFGRKRGGDVGALDGAMLTARLHMPSRLCRALNEEVVAPEETEALTRDEYEVLRGVDALVSPSASLLEIVRGELNAELGGDAPRGVVIPYPVDVDAVVREADEAAREVQADAVGVDGIADERPEMLYFGRLERRKGVHVLVEAAGLLAKEGLEFRVTLVGNDTMTGPGQGSMKTHLMKRVAELGLASRVRLRRGMARRELLGLMRRASMCCFPALWDNFPNATLEAMALGMPVVATRAGGSGEIVEDGVSGALCEAGDAEGLAEALKRVMEDVTLRPRVADGAAVRVRAMCDPAAVVRRVEELVQTRR